MAQDASATIRSLVEPVGADRASRDGVHADRVDAVGGTWFPSDHCHVRVTASRSCMSSAGPDSNSAPTELNVHLVCHGEEHTSNLWTVGNQTYDRDALREHLVTEFSDFVAESQFGWGQQR